MRYIDRIERAKERVQEAEHDCKITVTPEDTARKKNILNYEKKRFEATEKDLLEFESKAHREGIKSGWIRCQE